MSNPYINYPANNTSFFHAVVKFADARCAERDKNEAKNIDDDQSKLFNDIIENLKDGGSLMQRQFFMMDSNKKNLTLSFNAFEIILMSWDIRDIVKFLKEIGPINKPIIMQELTKSLRDYAADKNYHSFDVYENDTSYNVFRKIERNMNKFGKYSNTMSYDFSMECWNVLFARYHFEDREIFDLEDDKLKDIVITLDTHLPKLSGERQLNFITQYSRQLYDITPMITITSVLCMDEKTKETLEYKENVLGYLHLKDPENINKISAIKAHGEIKVGMGDIYTNKNPKTRIKNKL